MEIQTIILAFTLLLVSWALERVFARLQSVERHVGAMRKRLNAIEQRLLGVVKPSTSNINIQRQQRPQKSQTAQNSQPPSRPSASEEPPTITEQLSSSGEKVVCSFCGTQFDIGLDKCPKCSHINIEKYKVKRKMDNAPM